MSIPPDRAANSGEIQWKEEKEREVKEGKKKLRSKSIGWQALKIHPKKPSEKKKKMKSR